MNSLSYPSINELWQIWCFYYMTFNILAKKKYNINSYFVTYQLFIYFIFFKQLLRIINNFFSIIINNNNNFQRNFRNPPILRSSTLEQLFIYYKQFILIASVKKKKMNTQKKGFYEENKKLPTGNFLKSHLPFVSEELAITRVAHDVGFCPINKIQKKKEKKNVIT